MATLIGTAQGDVLKGTAGDDQIEGLGGSDWLTGGGGNDILLGGDDSDVLDGGSGDDRVEGGLGNDSITDNDGGNDLLIGGDGDDYMTVRRDSYRPGLLEHVEIRGGAGFDRITYSNASAASALIDAGDGSDRVILERSSPGTVVTLGAGRDALDLSQYQFVSGQLLTITDFQAGAAGDEISFLTPLGHYLNNWNQSLNPFGTGHLSFRQDGADAVLRIDLDGAGGMSGYDAILFKNLQASTLTLDNLDGYTVDGSIPTSVHLTGNSFMYVLTGNGGHDVLEGGVEEDFINGRGGDDVLRGGGGHDNIEGGAGNDTIEGGDYDDSLSDTSGGNDVMDGGQGNDSLYLYRLNRSLNEAVVMRGGDGDDYIQAWSYARGTVTIDGGTGDDQVLLWTSDNSQTITLGTGVDTLDLNRFQTTAIAQTVRTVTDFRTGPGGDIVLMREMLTHEVQGYDGSTNPFLAGVLRLEQRGADTALQIKGTFGASGYVDLLLFKNTTSTSFTGANFDGLSPDGSPPPGMTITGTANSDTLTGGFGNDVIDGLDGDDVLQGAAGSDVLRGGGGADVIYGGAGDDLLDGGDGDDRLEANHERGSDSFRGGAGNDTIFIYRVFSGATEHVVIEGGTGNDSVIYQNFDEGSVAIDLGTGADNLSLWGARGATSIVLGEGKDVVDFDRHYVSLLGEFAITIADYKPGEDRLDWGSYFARELVTWDQVGNPFATGHLKLQASGADVQLLIDRDGRGGSAPAQLFLTLQNTKLSALTRADFGGLPPDGSDLDRILRGSDGDDNLVGGTGNDALIGGLGNDRLKGGLGADALTGGSGNDVFEGTRAELAGDRIIDFGAGDRIVITDADLDHFSFARTGEIVTLQGGQHLTLAGFAGRLAAEAAPEGGVALVSKGAVLGDANGDGRADVIWRNDNGSLTNWLGRADGGFTSNDNNAFQSGVSSSWKVAATADVNGDGRSDIVWRNDNGALIDWLAQSNGSYMANDASYIVGIPTAWKIAGVADFNGDGRADILWRNDNGALTDWLANSAGNFTANDRVAYFSGVPTSWHVTGVGDFNADGRADILWRNDNGALTNWLGRADGGFTANDKLAYIGGVPLSWQVAGVGDINGDGRADILWRNSSGAITDWLARADGSFKANDGVAYVSGISPKWDVAELADFNGDGRADILWRNSNGAMTDWLARADGGFAANDAIAHAQIATSWHTQFQSVAWA